MSYCGGFNATDYSLLFLGWTVFERPPGKTQSFVENMFRPDPKPYGTWMATTNLAHGALSIKPHQKKGKILIYRLFADHHHDNLTTLIYTREAPTASTGTLLAKLI